MFISSMALIISNNVMRLTRTIAAAIAIVMPITTTAVIMISTIVRMILLVDYAHDADSSAFGK